jgi:hypothetical protein
MDVRLPDGTVIQNVPDGISKSDLVAKLKANGMNVPDSWGASSPAQAAQAQSSPLDSALGALKNVYGSFMEPAAAMTTGAIARPVSQVMGLAATVKDALTGNTDGDPQGFQQSVQNALTYSPRTQAGQQATSMLGNAANATIGNAARMTGNLYGSTASALGAPQGVSDALRNGVTEAVNQAPGFLGAKLPVADLPVAPKVNPLTAETLQNTRDAGFLVSPTDAGDTSFTGKLSTLSGSETKLQQAISRHNSGVQAPYIAAQDIGITDGNLTPSAIAAQKTKADGVYTAVKNVGPLAPDVQLASAMKSIGVRDAAVDKQFGSDNSPAIQGLQDKFSPKQNPNYTDPLFAGDPPAQYQAMDSGAIVDAVRGLRADAKKLYTKGQQDPDAARMADATQNTADALDDFLQRSLVKNGQPNLATAFTNARTQLAKIKSVEDAYNPQTGSIDASSLAQDLDRGVPLSGGLQQIAESYKAFPKAFQMPERLPQGGPTLLEQGGLVTALMHGEPSLAIASLARPVARAIVQRPAYQNRMVGIPQPLSPTAQALGALRAGLANPLSVLGRQGGGQQAAPSGATGQ